MNRLSSRTAQRGFTLIEAVIVIVVLGVLATIVTVFIRMPVQGYADSVARAEVTDQADLAMRRIARDLRLALPNSIRVSNDGSAIEFLLTKAGGRYLSAEDAAATGEPLDFLDPEKKSFSVVGAMPSLQRVAIGNYVVVNNLGEGMKPSDAWEFKSADRNIARINGFDRNTSVITLDDNPFAAQSTPMPSPTQRFQVVSGPVTYYCGPEADGTLALSRQWGYEIAAQQSVPPVGAVTKALVATRLTDCKGVFGYNTPDTRRSGLVVLKLSLRARNENDPTVRLVHQVHVDNTP
jgi:MSHA biogenesis protein MshO